MTDPDSLKLKQEMYNTFPLLYSRLESVSKFNKGQLPKSIRSLYSKVFEFCLNFISEMPKRTEADYSPRSLEIKTEVFPNFPILREKNKYKADIRNNRKEKEVSEDLCSKLFPETAKLTPGLFIVTSSEARCD